MKTKHTPGEWEVVRDSNPGHPLLIYSKKAEHSVADVFKLVRPGQWITDEEAEANAALIAKAPAMLEMLETLLGVLEGRDSYSPEALEELIKQAKGETA